MKVTIHTSNIRGDANSVLYPNEVTIDLKEPINPSIFTKDYVAASFKEHHRAKENYLKANCILVDIDNDHSEKPNEWFTEEDIEDALQDVPYIIHFSRHHLVDKTVTDTKGNKVIRKKRPKFHLVIPTNDINSVAEFETLMATFSKYFPFIDEKARDAAHFFFGTENPKVKIHDGNTILNEFLDQLEFDNVTEIKEIKAGDRNRAMHRYAVKVLKCHGDTEGARVLFDLKAECCVPRLEDYELNTIYRSAQKFYNKVIAADPSYKKPEDYLDKNSYIPTDFSDVAQASLIQKYFSNELKYSAATLNIVYRRNKWVESEAGAQRVAQELTERQLRESERLIIEYHKKCDELNAFAKAASVKKSEITTSLTKEQLDAYKGYNNAIAYKEYTIKRRSSHAIAASLKEVRPMVEIDSEMLDSDPFLLNTPSGTFDLRRGLFGLREHRAEDLITKITSVSPSHKGKALWEECLNKIFGSNKALISYVQEMCGTALVGKVFIESCVIAYGEGGNGKSTFFNSIAKVLGDYYGSIASDVLTTSIKRDKQADLAELRGKRLVIAAETKVGDRLDESTIKRMCSTDRISACKKYKDPFDFIPSHTLIIYTNNLPKVGTSDEGTWRRIIIIPFNHKFTGKEDIKNYSDVLVEEAGEYILYWLIEGAKRAIDNGFHVSPPEEVINAINGYKEQSDSVALFLAERCDTSNKGERCSSGELYTKYRNYCYSNGEVARSTTDFANSLKNLGYKKVEIKGRFYYNGISTLPIDLAPAIEDFKEVPKR